MSDCISIVTVDPAHVNPIVRWCLVPPTKAELVDLSHINPIVFSAPEQGRTGRLNDFNPIVFSAPDQG